MTPVSLLPTLALAVRDRYEAGEDVLPLVPLAGMPWISILILVAFVLLVGWMINKSLSGTRPDFADETGSEYASAKGAYTRTAFGPVGTRHKLYRVTGIDQATGETKTIDTPARDAGEARFLAKRWASQVTDVSEA